MLRLSLPFALVANAFSILMLAVLDRVLLAGGPLLVFPFAACLWLAHPWKWLPVICVAIVFVAFTGA